MPNTPPPAELLTFIAGMSEPQILLDNNYHIIAANTAYREQFSPGEDVVGRKCYEVSHHFTQPCDLAGESCPLAQTRQSGQRERVLHLHHTSNEQERAQVQVLCEAVQQVTGETVKLAWADQGYTGETARSDARAHGVQLEIVKRTEAKKGFVLLPRRWVV